MIPAPIPYDPRWTAKLLRRDVRNLKNKAVTKLKARFVTASKKASTTPDGPIESIRVEPVTSRCVESTPDVAQNEPTATLYELLEGHLKTTWAARDLDVSHKERWQFRGGWLVLGMALQACPSNASYDIFEGPKADDTAMMRDLADIIATNTSPIPHRISKMPAAPFQGGGEHVRYDSVMDGLEGYNAPNFTLSQLWRIVLEGATDSLKTASSAKELISKVWCASEADCILDSIGDPAKSFEWDDKLRSDIRTFLFPSYTTLSSYQQH